ncbi:retrovirus-related Pol polyprotein from transposon gypsy [Clonorchis sinensis]|uniref:Retrovirus-related Pol polyprotein from transposon gypsy n=1 Tax=Clonorchis sinensis TaxID=79923 RepID=G7YRG0_CLOSI|nr:retrovirus-related Pol polyprotein from transposon gypsy [Clonorchis sinensis]
MSETSKRWVVSEGVSRRALDAQRIFLQNRCERNQTFYAKILHFFAYVLRPKITLICVASEVAALAFAEKFGAVSFSSFTEFENALNQYMKANYVVFVRPSSNRSTIAVLRYEWVNYKCGRPWLTIYLHVHLAGRQVDLQKTVWSRSSLGKDSNQHGIRTTGKNQYGATELRSINNKAQKYSSLSGCKDTTWTTPEDGLEDQTIRIDFNAYSFLKKQATFNVLTRSHSQSVRDFVLQLQTQAAKCDYGVHLEDQLRDRLIAGIQLPELQQKLPLYPDQQFQTIRKIFSTSGTSIIGLKVLRSLRTSITSLTSVNVNELKQLILKCSKATGGMQIPEVKLEATGDPTFLKRRIIRFGLREPVRQALNSTCERGILTPVRSSNWTTPIVTPPKADGITPRIFGAYRLMLNTRLLETVLKPFSTKHHSTVITDASPTGIGTILEQCGRPVICISCRLSKVERGYSHTQREALVVYWAVKRLHKYLFRSNFTATTDLVSSYSVVEDIFYK